MERLQLQFEVEQFYYDEAAMLDERRFEDWLELLADDVHYWMPIRRTRRVDEADREFTAPGDMALFDDDKALLEMRVKKLRSGVSWSEDPPSRTRHLVTNVRIVSVEGDEITTEANIHLYRTRLDSEEDSWIGRRRDLLRRSEDGFRIARRHIFLEQTVLLSTNLSSLF